MIRADGPVFELVFDIGKVFRLAVQDMREEETAAQKEDHGCGDPPQRLHSQAPHPYDGANGEYDQDDDQNVVGDTRKPRRHVLPKLR